MKKYLSLFFTVICCLHLSSSAQLMNGSFMHNGVQRSYILYIPANYSASTLAPIVLNFHGYGGTAAQQMLMSNFQPIADTAGFIIASLQGTLFNSLAHWNVGSWTAGSTADDIGFVSDLLDTISSNYNVDTKRIYATGFSNGGFFSHRLACELGDRIAAIASVSGTMSPEIISACNPSHSIPVLQIHGTSDGTVPYTGNSFIGMKAVDTILQYWIHYNHCNTTPSVTALPDINTSDGSTVEHIVYANGDNGVTVEHFKVSGGDHTWPGVSGNMDINASLEIWKFFLKAKSNPVAVQSVYLASDKIKLYPNPVKDVLFLKIKEDIPCTYRVYNLIGTLLKEGTVDAYNNSIQLDDLKPSIYFLHLGNERLKFLKTE